MSRPAYNFVDATFHSFQVLGRRPLSVAWIALWQLIAYAGCTALILKGVWPLVSLLFGEAAVMREPSEAEVLAALMSGLGWIALGTVLILLFALMAQAAWLRLLTRNEVAPGIPFRFGGDEARLLLVNLGLLLALMVGQGVTIGAFVAINAGLAAGDVGALGLALLNTVLVLVAVVLWITVMLGFAAAPAVTVRQRTIGLFAGFAASDGIRGKMVLSYLVLLALWIGGYIIVATLQQIVLLFGAADLMPALMALDEAGDDAEAVLAVLGEVFSGQAIWIVIGVILVIDTLFQIACQAVWAGVGAYVAIRHDGGLAPDAPLEAPTASVGDAPSEG